MSLLDSTQRRVSFWYVFFIFVELKNFIKDLQYFESFYPGGLESYVMKAHELLMKSSQKENPMEGYIPSVGKSVK